MTSMLGKNAWRHASSWNDSQTISAEIFGLERSKQHARSLAESQKVTKTPPRIYSIIDRLGDNADALLEAYREICAAVAEGKTVTPAAEWLIDNYHLVEEQVRQTRADLPRGFYRQLPKLADGPLAGHPRIFGLVWAYVAHSDSRFDQVSLSDFVNEYQQVQPLTIGELWAVAISLRLILIENLRRISQRIIEARRDREAADKFADQLLDLGDTDVTFTKILAQVDEPKVSQQFVVQFIQRLRDQNSLATQALDWLKQKTDALGYTFESAVNDEHHRQAAANVTVRNIVTSMRLISDVNWEIWFDTVSLVDKLLRTSPNYSAMDFSSRTIYRTAVEELARGSGGDEMDVAQRALDLRGSDPGYYLIDAGRADFERALGFRPPILRRMRMAMRSASLQGYLGGIALIAVLAVIAGANLLIDHGLPNATIIILLALAVLPASDFGLAIANFMITRLMDAAVIPGLALREGVTEEFRTLVVVPTLITSRDEIEELVDRLEVHYLSNSDGELYFGLLTDWLDSTTETAPSDQMLLNEAIDGISRLNLRHDTNRFLLLHRGRKWNPQQNKWMGWERKRGKLHELNRLLRGATDTSFIAFAGKLPSAIRFVITLDADTKLPRDAARRLVGKLAHPLNQPKFDTQLGRVVQGFGVLQPRVTPSLPVGHYGSLFQRIYSSARGIDPYVFAVSDVYQDLFGEGSFAGKGIYDVDAFEAALAGKIPENTMLSHDLFEGVFARAALVTDIEVVEEYPERYGVAAARQHRWTRGDWQLLPWMFGANSTRIPALGLWKMIDNLRRSMSPVATILCFLVGWAILSFSEALHWTIFIVLLGLIPPLLPAISGAIPKSMPITVASRVKSSLADFGHVAALIAANLLFLGHQAGVMIDAVVRTIYRLGVSRRNLLEWTTAAQSESGHRQGVTNNYNLMASSVAAGMMAIAIVAFRENGMWLIALPFAVAWFAAPGLAFWMSRSPKLEDTLASSPEDRKILRLVARRTWRFFETFVTPAENLLPPDNFQEDPKSLVAHRTSPTNIGLYLLSIVSAREFGWLGLQDAVDRLEATLATVKRLEKYRGHLYNWYDTTDLHVLEPKYVSTVDSGNLAGHLIALSNYCSYWIVQPAAPKDQLDGIVDILDLLNEDLGAIPNDRRSLRPLRKQFELQVETLRRSIAKAAETPETVSMRLIEFAVQAANIHTTTAQLAGELNTAQSDTLLQWADTLRYTIESHFKDAPIVHGTLKKRLEVLISETHDLALAMEFGFLLDPQRLLLSIGYRVAESMRDESCYDMLASEARLASYFAIAKGDLRTRHWFRLGRTVTAVRGGAALVSWSGSMFEYLMPSLVMRAPSAGLLDQTSRLIVERQIDYANALGIPWGISESAFNARDIEFTYQYSNFGVPGLGLKRGLSENTVIAPYATGLAAMIAPRLAAKNYHKLAQEGGRGDYGYYEALDYTPQRLRKGETVALVRAYFAHHQGMSIVALFNAVKNGEMRDRFHAEPMIRATELLLQERAPRNVPITHARAENSNDAAAIHEDVTPTARIFSSPGTGSPVTHLLSNGQYNVMLTVAGSGYSTWNGQAITRWREDGVRDDWGSYIYLREPKTGKIWSAGHMPLAAASDSYSASFTEDKAEFVRKDGNFTTTLECVVSPEDNAEARRITISNGGLTAREIEYTSYAELVLSPPASDLAHPAFSKMFVETEYVAEHETLLATRRRRSLGDAEVWVAQFILVQGAKIGSFEFETDRAKFIGRGNDTRMPAAMANNARLSNGSGTVLDPIFALRQRFRIAAGRMVRCTLWTVVANSREAVLDLVDRHRQPMAYDRATMLAWTQAQIQLRHLSIGTDEANLYQTLGSYLIYANPALRAAPMVLMQDMGSQSALWPHGISGDRPILLLRIDDVEDIELVHQLLQAFEYWKAKGFVVDFVILNDRMSSYVQDLQNAIETLVRKISVTGGTGQVYLLRTDLTSPETLRVLPAVARVVLYGRRGDLASQLARVREATPALITSPVTEPRSKTEQLNTANLELFNGFGGFDADGREYVTILSADKSTPAPWINVVANSRFGFQSAAEGGGYTWFGNSRENQITPWSNDAVSNRQGEVIYVRDAGDGTLMSPTLAPLNSRQGTHLSRHGFGYTIYERNVHQLQMELLQCVPLGDTIKISRLRITNDGTSARTLTVTYYIEWILGPSRTSTAPYVITRTDETTGAMFARNPWKTQESEQVAFADMGGMQTNWTSDRREFLGTHGSLTSPQGLQGRLSNRTGAGLDPCCTMQVTLTLAAGETRELNLTLGAAANAAEAQSLITRYRSIQTEDVLRDVKDHWLRTLNATQVKTPDRTFNIIMNGWLLYQTLACRMWARSGFYQASGAYGFRDQLQDSMALLAPRPEIAREHILRAAGRQFRQGDFQHWWLPATGMGVRTRISDDTAWLANCVSHYVKVTGDSAILEEVIPFIEGQSLMPGEHDAFFLPSLSEESASLYEHCARALDLSLTQGVHGLPLIGTGDWNDGMNRVGEAGKGESVWLGWFLLSTLRDFASVAAERGDTGRVARWIDHMANLQVSLERDGWDGRWYRRGYFDDGSPLGSAENEECRIDAIAQSWAVLSGGAAPERATLAMQESYRQLLRPSDKLVLLFAPPFDKTEKDPGYIKAYPPGIRENGGQYTHGVIWSIFAHAKLGQTERAYELFNIINPINHALNEPDARTYRVEPYVISADVYSVSPNIGRGGWTWYTGSAAWMYRAGLEAILGTTREGNLLRIKPCIPNEWDGFEVMVQFGKSRYELKLQRSDDKTFAPPVDVKIISAGEYVITLRDTDEVRQITLPLGGQVMPR
jgi:cyclic beta-1,2-glucan synthetase